jgi:hypothetical protein
VLEVAAEVREFVAPPADPRMQPEVEVARAAATRAQAGSVADVAASSAAPKRR